MIFPKPSEDTVAVSARAIAQYDADARTRARKRAELARETGYTMLAPGMF
ncbi:hypothetical protein HSR121_2009 [Halapricum desulfuricans]|uniref:Uncharacterized protein n=1 Tax=Halapricum desulfuricans TaxID=2841257 RepID=A0A897N092_9EURY|nr:hypothetical protein HSR121_2009 [Halapricum desulfuricans]